MFAVRDHLIPRLALRQRTPFVVECFGGEDFVVVVDVTDQLQLIVLQPFEIG